jgi:hypothetical protein
MTIKTKPDWASRTKKRSGISPMSHATFRIPSDAKPQKTTGQSLSFLETPFATMAFRRPLAAHYAAYYGQFDGS